MRKFILIYVVVTSYTDDEKKAMLDICNPNHYKTLKTDRLQYIIDKYAPKSVIRYGERPNCAFFYFYEDMPEYENLKEDATKLGLKIDEEYNYEYTDSELKEIPYFMLDTDSNLKAKSYDNVYANGCSYCGQGAVLTGICKVPSRSIKKFNICYLKPEIIINSSIYNALKEENISGYVCEEVCNQRSQKKLENFYRLIITNQLPPMNETTPVRKKICKKCHSTSIEVTGNIRYDSSALKDAKDFNISSEHYSYMKDFYLETNYSRPYVIVSQRVREILLKYAREEEYELFAVEIENE